MKNPKGSEYIVSEAMFSMLVMTVSMMPKHQRKNVAIHALHDQGLPFGDEERVNTIRALEDPNSPIWKQIEEEITRTENNRIRVELVAEYQKRQEAWSKKTCLQKLLYVNSIVLLGLLSLVVSFIMLTVAF